MTRDPKYDVLFEPVEVGPKTTKNRFWQTPHCNGAGSDRPGTQAAFRGMKAEGGWGTVCIEYTAVHPESDDAPHCCARLWDEVDVMNLGHVADEVHKHGGLAGIQLFYAGIHSQTGESRAIARVPSQAPSEAILANGVAEADEDDIRDIVQMHVDASLRARDAGFDVIEIIASDSMIVLQFLQPFYNRRTDGYGGSFENRARLWIEILEGMKEAVGSDCAIGNRFSVDTLEGPDGIEVGEDGIRMIELCARQGLCDVWDLKVGHYSELSGEIAPSRFTRTNYMAPWVREAKAASPVPVVSTGRLTSPDDMVEVIVSGQADLIGAARPSIADPFLPRKIEEGRPEDIRECIGCNVCLSKWAQAVPLICTQNATSMEEYRRGWHPEKFTKTKSPCSVLVVGAGPAGLECARVLGERGYDVHLREAEAEIGGRVRDIMRYPGLAEWGRVITYRQIQLDKLKNVEVHTGVGRMSADDVLAYGADKVVCATGARWAEDGFGPVLMAPLAGADASLPHVATPEQVMAGKDIGERVVVLDCEGYFTGVSMAELLADQGKKVTLVTSWDFVAPYTAYSFEFVDIMRMLHEKKIEPVVQHAALSVEPGRITLFYIYRDGYVRTTTPKRGVPARRMGTETVTLECDGVVLVTARLSQNGLFKELKARRDEWAANDIQAVYQVGDCQAPRLIADCVFEGHRLAREFESDDPQHPLPWIRERQIWGHEAFPKLAG
ncbi:MAG: FAD-dependent oxidoreductase [Proteobacteria bacterium]|nr:FAD-dependent oxidoreductase [Pseudomonadota bacterium]